MPKIPLYVTQDLSPYWINELKNVITNIPDPASIDDKFYKYALDSINLQKEKAKLCVDFIVEGDIIPYNVPLYHYIKEDSPLCLKKFAIQAVKNLVCNKLICPLPVVGYFKTTVFITKGFKSKAKEAYECYEADVELEEDHLGALDKCISHFVDNKLLKHNRYVLDDYCALTFSEYGGTRQFWYESDGFKVEILRLTNKKPLSHEFRPFLIVLKENTVAAIVSPKYFACIVYSYFDVFDKDKVSVVEKVLYSITINDVTYDIESRLLKSDNKYKLVLAFNFHISIFTDKILFSRYIYLCESENPAQKNIRGIVTGLRNAIVIYENKLFRIQRVKYFLNTDEVDFKCFRAIADMIKSPFSDQEIESNTTDEEDRETEFLEKRQKRKGTRKVQSFICPYLKRTKPCLYVVYDVETVSDVTDEEKHYVFCICAEAYVQHPEDYCGTQYEITKFHCFEEPGDDLPAMEARVVVNFLKQIVNFAQQILDSVPFFEWQQYTSKTNYATDDEIFFNIRIVGYNSSNYDDKFVIQYFDQVFNYHGRKFSSRGQTVNKHVLMKCHVFEKYTDHVQVSFQDIMRFTPEISSLKEACKSLEIEVPKIDFSSVTFMRLHAANQLVSEYTVLDLLIIFFGMDNLIPLANKFAAGQKPIPFFTNKIKNAFVEIFTAESGFVFPPADQLLTAKYKIIDIVKYYCERDVTATRLILSLISTRFHVILKNLFLTQVECVSTSASTDEVKTQNNPTFYSQLRQPSHIERFIAGFSGEEQIPVPAQKSVKDVISVDEAHVTDIFGYISVAQISYTFIKCLMRSQGLLKLNSTQVELIKFIKASYFGGLVQFGFVGLLKKSWKMIDVKSEYPLAMTGPLPVYNDKYMFKSALSFEDVEFLQEIIDDCTFFRNEAFEKRRLHLFRPHFYINFLAVLLCKVTPPPSTQASIFSCLPFPEFISTDSRSIRFFTVPQTRVLTTHHICALILQGWKIEICNCETNIVFNCDKKNIALPLNKCIGHNSDEHCYLRQFVSMFGKAKAAAADDGSKVDKKLYKAILNSGAGRLGMKDTSQYINVNYKFSKPDIREFLENARAKITTFGSSNFDMATFINSAGLYIITSWQYLLQLKDIYPNNIPLHERHPIVAYTDTDSILYDSDNVLPEVVDSLIMSNEIGIWENDHFKITWSQKYDCNTAVLLGKKSYLLLNEDEKGFKDVVVHNKGIPTKQVVKQFYDGAYLKKSVLDELLSTGRVSINYQHILKTRDTNDLSQKTFFNETISKKLNVAELGGSHLLHGGLYNFSFMPKIPTKESEQVYFTHSPCHFLDCEYCVEWYFNLAQSIEAYNWKFDRII